MALTGNPLLKLLVIPVVIGAILIGVSMMGKKESAQSQGAATPTVTSEEAATLGIDGDTPADTLRTIVAESRQLKDQISKVIQENDSLKAANENLQGRLRNIDQNIEQKLNNTAQELQQQQENRSQTILDQVQKRLENLTHVPEAGDTDLPVGFGVRPEDGQHFQGAGSSSSDIVWIEPQDARAVDANGQPLAAGSTTQPSGFSFPTSFGNAVDRGQNALERIDDGLHPVGQQRSDLENRKLVRKTYTLPQNSTLMGSVAMSALIGRVPVDGTVNDPYPFKILIGPDNLTANGIELPDVAGAVASGTASGDWTLSCVRGQIRSLTFVFNDGTVRTFPAPTEEVNDNQSNNNQTASADQKTIQGGLGWISDPYGIPCIAGDRRSNAKEYGQSEPTHGCRGRHRQAPGRRREQHQHRLQRQRHQLRDDRNQQQLGPQQHPLRRRQRHPAVDEQAVRRGLRRRLRATWRAGRRASRSATGDRLRTQGPQGRLQLWSRSCNSRSGLTPFFASAPAWPAR